MIFTEFRFFFFFLIAFCVHWALRSNTSRKVWLLGCSYIFYGAWDWRFLGLILFSTVVDYVVGLRLGATDDVAARKRWLRVSLVGNLGLLGVFKYFNFFVDSGVDFANLLGLQVPPIVFEIGLPVGISFYTFQTLSYSLDVYFRRMQPTRNVLDLALFVAFFPQLVAGPIVRAIDFLPQLKVVRRLSDVDVRGCLILFLVGFIKKAVVSDNIAQYVDAYFGYFTNYDVASAYLAVPLYAAQLYCDFSAYSDMAIACAGLLGYNLMLNFDFPYFAPSIKAFWARWHISLSSWVRDYLFNPLGGSRGSELMVWRNISVTWLLLGLWHGADWTYVLFGGWMIPALLLQRYWGALGPHRKPELPPLVGNVLTMWWICVAIIFFRSENLDKAWGIVKVFVFFQAPGDQLLGDRLVWLLVGLTAVHWVSYKGYLAGLWDKLGSLGFTAGYATCCALVLTLINPNAAPFIYFQF